jgi:GTP:adenosylcobinamide-phosphate guanylyltransferase
MTQHQIHGENDTAPLPVSIIVLAAQRAGVVDPLAVRAGVSHKCLVPICGRPLLAHVLETLTTLENVHDIRVVLEPEGQAEIGTLVEKFAGHGVPIRMVDSHPNIAESVLAGASDGEGPFIVATADNVLLTHEGLNILRQAMRRYDAVLAVTTRERVLAVHEEGQRHFYKLKEARYANCNLYGLSNRRALRATDTFRDGGQFQARPLRFVRALGLVTILLMGLKLITLSSGLARLGRRFGISLTTVVFEDGALAIDVDNERTYAICEWVLGLRLGLDVPKPVIPPDAL